MSDRPLPNPAELDTAEFWRATMADEFRYQQCRQCNTVIWYPRAHCPGCTQGELEWQVASGRGTLYSFSIVRQSYQPFFRDQVPYAVAWVDLEEGPRFLTNVVDCDVETLQVGQAVEICWEAHDKVHIPLVKPR